MYKLAFVILTWNSAGCIGPCLRAIGGLDGEMLRGKVYVVDNGSTDNTVDVINEVSEEQTGGAFPCQLIRLERNFGTTYSRNLAIKEILREPEDIRYVCILDSDTQVNTNAVVSLIEVLEKDRQCAIVGPRMHSSDGVYQRSGRNIPTATEKLLKVAPAGRLRRIGREMECSIAPEGKGTVPVGYLMSACWMMRRELFDRVGLLDEKIFYAPEDVEYCVRCLRQGYKILYCYDADIVHQWQRLSRKKLFSRHNYEHLKGLGYLFWKHRYLFSGKKFMTGTKG